MDILKAAFCCFSSDDDTSYTTVDQTEESVSVLGSIVEKRLLLNDYFTRAFDTKNHEDEPENANGSMLLAPPLLAIDQDYSCGTGEKVIAENILRSVYAAETSNRVHDEFLAQKWTGALANHILHGLVKALVTGQAMGGPVKEAYEYVAPHTENFVHEHPVLTAVVITLTAICILEHLLPWAVAALGFGDLGPIEGSFAAWWQSCYGDVPYKSLFSFIQGFAMRPATTQCVDQGGLNVTLTWYVLMDTLLKNTSMTTTLKATSHVLILDDIF
ncbi:hypothetical protein FKW77_005707 [Venturia effusa]|uniref:Uncharacterized protein n=1 Tax=Venturia effusa TaxID=50376 RepID=A0A517L9D4_9PEZI|nr:hypothetical protein FKW77_005707 [Venturia effusa]